jgi:hypothetical protein
LPVSVLEVPSTSTAYTPLIFHRNSHPSFLENFLSAPNFTNLTVSSDSLPDYNCLDLISSYSSIFKYSSPPSSSHILAPRPNTLPLRLVEAQIPRLYTLQNIYCSFAPPIEYNYQSIDPCRVINRCISSLEHISFLTVFLIRTPNLDSGKQFSWTTPGLLEPSSRSTSPWSWRRSNCSGRTQLN